MSALADRLQREKDQRESTRAKLLDDPQKRLARGEAASNGEPEPPPDWHSYGPDAAGEPQYRGANRGEKKGEPGRTEGEFNPEEAKRRARAALVAKDFKPPAYPVDALGEVLAPAARSIAGGGQLAPAMAGQALLGAAAVLAQGHRNVKTLAGVKPLSAYLLTIADSGDGKSTADGAALRPVQAWQRERADGHNRDMEQYRKSSARRKKDEPPEDPPAAPWILMRDATVEGVRAGFQHGRASQGIFTAEAGAMLAGYGMSKDNRQKTCAVFNELWDDGELSVSRVAAGRVQLYGKRLSCHWLIQPDAAREALGDALLSAMGFWAPVPHRVA